MNAGVAEVFRKDGRLVLVTPEGVELPVHSHEDAHDRLRRDGWEIVKSAVTNAWGFAHSDRGGFTAELRKEGGR